MICKHKLPKTNITMSSGRSTKKGTPPNICGICLCRTCNSQFGVKVYSNHCVFHPPNEQQKQKIQEKEQNKIERIKQINDDNLRRVKDSSKSSFFNSVYEKFNPRQSEVSCRHCFLNNYLVEYSFFQQYSTLKSKDYKYHINNINDFCNVTQMKANHLLDEYKCFFTKTMHTLYFDENIHRPATLLQNSVFGLKIIDGFGDCGVLAILFSILSGATATRTKIAENVYKFIRKFEKTFTLKELVAEIFQIKYLRQALFHAKLYKNLSDKQKTSNMFDLSDFIDDDDIFAMRDKIVKLLEQKQKLEDELKRTPKKQDKETIKKRLAPINKELHHSYPTYEKKYNDAKSKFMISTEQTLNEDDIYWLTNNDMINLPLIASIGVLCVYDNSKDINQN